MNCKNCGKEVNDQFCSGCGHPVQLKRVDGHYILHEILHFLHLEKGIPYTVKELLITPGKSIRGFISDDRNRLVKPILFLIVCSVIYTFVTHLFHVEFFENNANPEGMKILKGSAVLAIFEWIQHYYGYANILMGLCVAFWLKLLFGEHDYNFFELLILMCFVIGAGMLILTLFGVIQSLVHTNLPTISTLGVVAYSSWAMGQFFGQKKFANYFKALVSYLLGSFVFYILILFTGILIDILRH